MRFVPPSPPLGRAARANVLVVVGPHHHAEEVRACRALLADANVHLVTGGRGERVYDAQEGEPLRVDCDVEEYGSLATPWDAVVLAGSLPPAYVHESPVIEPLLAAVREAGGIVAAFEDEDAPLDHLPKQVATHVVRLGRGREAVGRLEKLLDRRARHPVRVSPR